MNNCINGNIQTPEGLGAAHIGFAHTAIAPHKSRIYLACYGRGLAGTEGGILTTYGNAIPISAEWRAENAA